VTFMTIEDETDVANLVIWSAVFEKQRRLILSSHMIGCRGRLQREGGVTHLIAEHFIDLSDLLRSVAERDGELRLRSGRGDEARTGTRDWVRSGPQEGIKRPETKAELKEPVIEVAARNFR
jgi:error-prone DNA polymerase